MLSDKEMLKLAAIASGMVSEDADKKLVPLREDQWNPLNNNDEAFVLAVKLKMDVCIHDCGRMVRAYVNSKSSGLIAITKFSDDVLAATRLAIVEAAAELELAK